MRPSSRGFTVIEMMVTIAIVAIVAALAYVSIARQRPRANLQGTTTELYALLRSARQNALTTGRNTVVMVFPNASNTVGGTGRVVATEDPTNTFFGAAAPNFQSFDPAQPVNGGDLLGEIPLPRGITVGLGGAAAPTLPAPYSTIASGECTFCAATGDRRGAIVFDSRGRARFYSAVGPPLAVFGGTIALQGLPEVNGFRLLVITSTTGSVWALNAG